MKYWKIRKNIQFIFYIVRIRHVGRMYKLVVCVCVECVCVTVCVQVQQGVEGGGLIIDEQGPK